MTSEEYAKYLSSEKWQWIRKRKLLSHPTCQQCGHDRQLNVHHLSYERVGGRELDSDLWQTHRTEGDELKMRIALGYSNEDIRRDVESDPDFIIVQR